MTFPIWSFVIPLVVSSVAAWLLTSRAAVQALSDSNRDRLLWLAVLLGWLSALPISGLAINRWPIEWPGAIWPCVVVLAAVTLIPTQSKTGPSPALAWTRRVLQGLVLVAGVYASFPLLQRDAMMQLYPLGMLLAVVSSAIGLYYIQQRGAGRSVMIWSLIALVTPALLFAQVHLTSAQAIGATLISFGAAAVICWWRGQHWLSQPGQMIMLGLIAWLMVNAQLRFDWYSIDADWERYVVTFAPLIIPFGIWMWLALDRGDHQKRPWLACTATAIVLIIGTGAAVATYLYEGEQAEPTNRPSFDYGSFGS